MRPGTNDLIFPSPLCSYLTSHLELRQVSSTVQRHILMEHKGPFSSIMTRLYDQQITDHPKMGAAILSVIGPILNKS